MPKLSAAAQVAAISRIRGMTAPSRGATQRGFRVPDSIATTGARSSTAWGTSTGRPIDMTKSMLGSRSQSAAKVSTSASRARRRSPLRGSRT